MRFKKHNTKDIHLIVIRVIYPMSQQSHEELKQFILPLFTELPASFFQCIGSCVVITTAKKWAVALTAKHVIDHSDALHSEQTLAELKVAAPFRKKPFDSEFAPLAEPWPPMRGPIFAFLPSHKSMAILRYVSYFPGASLDVAAITLELIQGPIKRFPMQCAIASNGPSVEEPLMLCGYPNVNTAEVSNDLTELTVSTGRGLAFGKCISRFDWDEDYMVKSPGFIVNAGSPSGFSGGAVLANTEAGMTLMGIIAASDDVQTKAAIIWPALGLKNNIPHDSSVPDDLLGLASLPSAIRDIHDAPSHVNVDATKRSAHLREHVMWT